ncbi:MAG TPA: phage head closure protein [Pseudolabrys sp.]|jgi:SPP1 family predicted phage head-tail adaptor|nr:phage head closure protein [Pseudolabrys sp.]
MTAAGELNRRLALNAPVDIDDGAGGVFTTYQLVTTLWAQVTPAGASPDISADSLGAARRYVIVIRYRDDVTTRHRFQDGERIFRIVAVQESADRRFLEITAEERTA